MAFAPLAIVDEGLTGGQFQTRGYLSNYFEWIETDSPWARAFGFRHQVYVGNDGQYRYANVGKTVATVVIDEGEYGQPITEKWQIKTIWRND